MSDEEKQIEQVEEQIDGATTTEDTATDTQDVQEVEPKTEEKQVVETDEKADEAGEAGNKAEEKTEDTDRKDAEATNTEEPVEEGTKEGTADENSEDNQTPEDMRAELEELRYSRDEENALREIGKAQSDAQSEMQEFQTRVTQILEQGLKHYGIDPEKSIEDIAKEDPAKADIARGLLNSSHLHIQAMQ